MAVNLDEVQGKIRGWLIVVGVVLWIDAIVGPLAFIAGLFVSRNLLFTTPYEIQLAGFLVDAIANIIMLILFIKKKKAFIGLAVAYQIYSVVVELAIIMIDIIHHLSFWKEALALTIPVVLFFYLIRSKRVKMTFVH